MQKQPLQKPTIFFEIVPPNRAAPAESRERFFKNVAAALASLEGIDYLNVPEVADENHVGKPHYRNEDACVFSDKLSKATGLPAIVNKMVVHCEGEKGFLAWLDEAVNRFHVKDFVLVGGYRVMHQYPGPPVFEATRLALARHNVRVGHIAIPTREGEAERMVQKTLAGGSFFTTQVLFSADPLRAVLESYQAKCEANGVKAGEVYLSFAPVHSREDLEFLQWLGAEISPTDERALFASPAGPVQASIDLAQRVWQETQAFSKEAGLKVRLGLNLAPIFQHNLGSAVELARQFAVLTDKTRL